MNKPALPAAFAALLLAACASAESPRPGSSAFAQGATAETATPKQECTPPPAELVKHDLAPGEGEPVTTGSAVLVGYTGWLYDPCAPGFKGRMFDTSKGRPAPFGLVVGAGKVIKGWDEGLVGMKPKGRRLLVIPPEKGYGSRGAGNRIPPGATLVFEVELVQVLQRPATAK